MIKFGFTEPGSLDKEYMWVMPHSINGDLVVGTLENAPVSLRTYRESQTVEMPISSMVDWISVIGEDMQGGFCERKLRGIR